jgi:hypothetical protein
MELRAHTYLVTLLAYLTTLVNCIDYIASNDHEKWNGCRRVLSWAVLRIIPAFA